MTRRRWWLLAGLVFAVVLFFALDLDRFASLEVLKAEQARFEEARRAAPWRTAALYFLAYVAVTGLSLPGAAVMTLAVGALFGPLAGTLIVSFASTIGATLAFLASRHVFRDAVRARLGTRLDALDRGIAREGAFYLFTLRLVPVFPFFLVNLAMGLTRMPARTFAWVSQIGMLPGTVAYVLAGTQLGAVQRPQDVLSPSLLVAFAALGLLPLVLRRVAEALRARRVYAGWPRPRRFDRNVVVIGAGAAGLVASYVAAAVKARVTLVERERMGGDCLNTGCVPSKALIRTATFLSQVRRSAEFGVRSASAEFDFADVMSRVRRVVDEIAPHDSVERYTGLGVECLAGEARITSPWTVEVRSGGEVRTLSTRAIVIATGARPRVPPIPGIESVDCLTSDTLWSLRELPGRLLVLGGGPIGCELAQAFARLGSRVCLVESEPRLLAREDTEVSEAVAAALRADGVSLHLGRRVTSFVVEDGVRLACCDAGATSERLAFDTLLCAVGRVARVEGFGLEDLGIAVSPAGTLEVDAFMATRFPNILACGDVAGPWQFTHMAAHTAWYASVNGLFGGLRRFRADMRLVPRATFTDPEVASVGLNETAARAAGVPCEVTTYGLEDLDRAIVDGEARGSVKVLTVPGRDRILGVTIVGHHAGDLLAEFVLAMRQGIGLNRILGTIHVYPTLAEASKAVAGRWRQAHAPARALRWLERFHAWRRG
jgi:pyruvate/2-oxoglutarate dehydrogenase complex dihydrolipoamide dehydrogenase (E3) component/uncharacterized membrane protein YdjX (TVP38/TMEM64 family)